MLRLYSTIYELEGNSTPPDKADAASWGVWSANSTGSGIVGLSWSGALQLNNKDKKTKKMKGFVEVISTT